MKKTLIALAVAASAVSGMAHAWTNGDFNDSITIGGSIGADDYRQKWAWQVGDDINDFHNVISDMTDNKTKLTLTVNGNKAILLGKTVEAFSTPSLGMGGVPHIAFSDYEGHSVELRKPGTDDDTGRGYAVLPMKNAEGAKIGSIKVNVSFAAVSMRGHKDDQQADFHSLWTDHEDWIFHGGTPGNGLLVAQDAAARLAMFGNLSQNDMFEQIKRATPNVTNVASAGVTSENMSYTDGTVASAAYALGIANGQTIEATFDQAVTTSTQWSAPLNISVTYI
ncbi:fimbrial protein [Salmonella enterica]|nr:fimbrial protein [Salmonella enterica]